MANISMTILPSWFILAAVACLCACTASPAIPGHAGAERTRGTAPPLTTPTSLARPRTVSLYGIGPCGLLTTGDAAGLLAAGGRALAPDAYQRHQFSEPACRYKAGVRELDIATITSAGIHNSAIRPRWTQTAETAPINGFPALSLIETPVARRCSIAVDVADEQHVLVQYGDQAPNTRSADLCVHARTTAQLVMARLSP